MVAKKKRKPRAKKKVYKKLCGYCIQYGICKTTTGFNMEACDDFEIVDIFHCDRNGQRIHIAVCIARREKNCGNMNCSKKCLQGKLISKMVQLVEGGK